MAKELKIENKYVYLSFAVGILYYLAYYLKFPNSYSAIVSFALLTLLIKNFKKIDGLKIVICSLIISLITLASSLTIGSYPLMTWLTIFLLNLMILLLMVFGLKGFKKWAFYLSVIMLALGVISVFGTIVNYDAQYFIWTIQNVIFNLKVIASISFSLAAIIFLMKFRKAFSFK